MWALSILGKVYDIKTDALSKKIWALTEDHFEGRCAYCHTPAKLLPRGVKMTMEHRDSWRGGCPDFCKAKSKVVSMKFNPVEI